MKILVIDDEQLLREEIAAILTEQGHECSTAANGYDAIEQAQKFQPHVVLCDLAMPDIDGLTVLDRIRNQLPETQTVIITAFGTMESAIDAFRRGACDFILKPINVDDLFVKIERIQKQRELLQELGELRRIVQKDQRTGTLLIGQSPSICGLRKLIEQLAYVDSSILLLGETGTGKEVVARRLHEQSRRANKPFVTVNCAAVPETLIESELFGHSKGSFTGAIQDKKGLFEAAKGGSLFLDEFCEMPFLLQSKLLRVLERKEIVPVGSTVPIPVDVRLIAATNRNPIAFVEEGQLREDLYYRIRVMEVDLPPLRERREDIPELAHHFVDIYNEEMKRTVQGLSNSALQALMLYPWPGNVRELKNAVERAMIFSSSGFLQLEHFPVEISEYQPQTVEADELKAALKAYENAHILAVLNKTHGNRVKASELLGVDRSTLHRKLATMEEEGSYLKS